MTTAVPYIKNINGELTLPGDKSISHRAVMFAAMAKGKSIIKNHLDSADVNSTINIMKNLGAVIEFIDQNTLEVTGVGFKNFNPSSTTLDAGNSGTTARLMSGILSAQNFTSSIYGDESLSKRPMDRIINPLKLMGAQIESDRGKLPLTIYPSNLHPVDYELPVASAQVKSAVLLAGLHLDETTHVIEPVQCRNHTEVMLGLPVEIKDGVRIISSNNSYYPVPQSYEVPSDISTAAFFIVAALIKPGSELLLKNIGLNETRTGIIGILKEMGGKIEVVNEKIIAGEKIGDLLVSSSDLQNVEIPAEIIPNIIDEIPILAIAGLFAEGDFEIRNASELRAKESDRINSLVHNFRKMDLDVAEFDDGFILSGLPDLNKEYSFDSFGDHRIAMAFSVLASQLKEGGKIADPECVSISNPKFFDQLKQISNL